MLKKPPGMAPLLYVLTIATGISMVTCKRHAIVHTELGLVEGTYETEAEAYSFKGIPFAKPPVGELRWKRPKPLTEPWNGVYQAKTFPPQCAQLDFFLGEPSGEEDCLYLNVYTPSVNKKESLPVMVYIHGGFLQFINAQVPGYSPDATVAKKTNMVQVSIQYRLAGFGFLVLDELPGKGNYGMWDMLEALQWVQKNIAAFGGDPDLVTVYGQSSGGTAVFTLMSSPLSRGLFHRAYLISGSVRLTHTIEEAKKMNGEEFIGENTTITKNCPEVTEECLQSMDWKDIANLIYPFWSGDDLLDMPTKGRFMPPMVVIEEELLPEAPFEAWEKQTGNYNDVPTLITSTAQENDFWPAPYEHLNDWTKEEFEDYVASKLDPFSDTLTKEALDLYPWEHSNAYVMTSMSSDIRVNCPTDIQAEKAAIGLNSNVYRAVITSWPSVPVYALGVPWAARYAFHLWDSYAFFAYIDNIIENPTKADKDFEALINDNVVSFAKYGKPADPRWEPFPKHTALISDQIDFVDRYNKEQCELWMDNGMMEYAWINK